MPIPLVENCALHLLEQSDRTTKQDKPVQILNYFCRLIRPKRNAKISPMQSIH
jgi:hypothetical protein